MVKSDLVLIIWYSYHKHLPEKHHDWSKPELYPMDLVAVDALDPVIHGDVPQPVRHLVLQGQASVPEKQKLPSSTGSH